MQGYVVAAVVMNRIENTVCSVYIVFNICVCIIIRLLNSDVCGWSTQKPFIFCYKICLFANALIIGYILNL